MEKLGLGSSFTCFTFINIMYFDYMGEESVSKIIHNLKRYQLLLTIAPDFFVDFFMFYFQKPFLFYFYFYFKPIFIFIRAEQKDRLILSQYLWLFEIWLQTLDRFIMLSDNHTFPSICSRSTILVFWIMYVWQTDYCVSFK